MNFTIFCVNQGLFVKINDFNLVRKVGSLQQILSINVRIMYFIIKIDSLKFFTIIYMELHDQLPLSIESLTNINTIVYR